MAENADDTTTPVIIMEQDIRMKKTINLLHCVSILCAVTGHVSVFVAPTAILQYTGSIALSLILWILGGIINLFLALCFTELATMFPKAGGPYAYVMQVYGPLPAFIVVWGYLSLITGPFWAFMSYSAALYITQVFYSDCRPPESTVKLIAAWFLVTFVALNCVYVKIITKIQTVLSLIKLLALLLIIACGAITIIKGDASENLDDVWEGTSRQPSVVAMAFFFSVFTYGGWQIIANLMEEVKDPGRDLPRAVYVSLFIITGEYVLVNLAYYAVLTPSEIMQSETVALLFFERFYPPLKVVITVLVALTAIGVLNASILGHSRVLFAASRSEQAPVVLSMISTKFYTPWPAIFTILIWSEVMLFSGGLFMMIELISLFSILLSLVVVFTVLYLRWKRPHIKRPYQTYLFIPILMLVMIVTVLFLCVYQDAYKLGRGLIILAAGFPIYIIGVRWKRKPKVFQKFMNSVTVIIQKVLLVRKSA